MKQITNIRLLSLVVVIVAGCGTTTKSTKDASGQNSMNIKGITMRDIRAGKTWRLCDPYEFKDSGENSPDWKIEECENPRKEDYVVYSAVYAMTNGQVKPLVLIKQLEAIDFGGAYCEYVEGKWRRVGETPNPKSNTWKRMDC